MSFEYKNERELQERLSSLCNYIDYKARKTLIQGIIDQYDVDDQYAIDSMLQMTDRRLLSLINKLPAPSYE